MNKLFVDNLSGADFSRDRKFRYYLWRTWDESKPKAMCIGLNPSTANERTDDATIRNLKQILTHLGFGGLIMVNCFPIISSKPEILRHVDANDGDNTDNQYMIGELANDCTEVIFAWGNFTIVSEKGLDKRWTEMFPNAKCFGKNKNGTPMHPRALSYQGKLNSPSLQKFKS